MKEVDDRRQVEGLIGSVHGLAVVDLNFVVACFMGCLLAVLGS